MDVEDIQQNNLNSPQVQNSVTGPVKPEPSLSIQSADTSKDLVDLALSIDDSKQGRAENLQPEKQAEPPANLPSINLSEISVNLIRPNPWQPRKYFNPESLQELADSIREHGILQPLVVVPLADGYYQLIVGERRLRAAQLAGLEKVPAIIKEGVEEQKKLELALIENIQRHNLDPIEEAMAYQQLIDQYKLTQEEVAKKVGKGRTTVTNMLRLLHLPIKIQRAVAEGVISEGHARAILSVPGMEKQLSFYEIVVVENLTVRQAEERARGILERPKAVRAQRAPSDPEVAALESELRGKLGTKVKVQKSGESGKITIEFFSQEELQNFMEKMSKLEQA